MTTKNISILIALVLVLGAAGAFFLSGGDDSAEDIQSTNTILGEGYTAFTHSEYKFYVEYPEGFSVERFEEDLPEDVTGETIVFQDKDDAPHTPINEKTGFQIFIVPFQTEVGEQAELTEARILEDLPAAEIIDPKPVIINPDAPESERIEGLLFWSTDGRGNRTREVWFIHQGNLYEITTYEHLDTWLAQILSSWRLQ